MPIRLSRLLRSRSALVTLNVLMPEASESMELVLGRRSEVKLSILELPEESRQTSEALSRRPKFEPLFSTPPRSHAELKLLE